MPEVVPAKAVRHEFFHRLPEEFLPLVAKEFFGLGIDERDVARRVHDDHGVWSRLEQGAKLVFGPNEFARMSSLGLTVQAVGGHGGSVISQKLF